LYWYCPYCCVISKFSRCRPSNTTRQNIVMNTLYRQNVSDYTVATYRPEDGYSVSRNMSPI
jgi:hypothetical protein